MTRTSPTSFARDLRQKQTEPERRLWNALRNRKVHGYKFRRQVPIAGYVVDLLCASERLVVEVDGLNHAEQIEYDAQRTRDLEASGFTVMRVGNDDIMDDLDATLDRIYFELKGGS